MHVICKYLTCFYMTSKVISSLFDHCRYKFHSCTCKVSDVRTGCLYFSRFFFLQKTWIHHFNTADIFISMTGIEMMGKIVLVKAVTAYN